MPKTTMPRALAKTKRPLGVESPPPQRMRLPAFDQAAYDTLTNLVAGLMTSSDKRAFNQYPITVRLNKQQLEDSYRQSWLAKRIVNTVAQDMCREWVALTWDDYDVEDEGARQVEQAEKVFGLRAKVLEGLTWGRLYGGAGIIIGIKGDTDFSKPLILDNVRKGSLQFLHVLDRWRLAATGELDMDLSSPNFGFPKYYTVSDIADPRFRVHWSRVVRFGGEQIPWWPWASNGYWDDSVLQHVMQTIMDYDATMGGIASMVFEANVDIIKSPGLRDQLGKPGGADRVAQRFQTAAAIKSINKTLVLDGGDGTMQSKGEEYQQKTIAFSGLKDIVEKFMINVCGAADIPMTRLFGQSPAGMTATGESDIRNYYDHVSSQQEAMLRPQLERLYQVLVRSTLGPMPENFGFTFNPLWQTSDKEQAEVEKLRAERDHIYLTDKVLTEKRVAAELLDRRTYRTMEEEDVDEIEAMAEEAAKMQQKLLLSPPTKPGGGGGPPGGGAAHQGGEVEATQQRGSKVGDMLKREADGYSVYSENGAKQLGGPYKTKQEAVKRLLEVERGTRQDGGKNTGSQVVGHRDFAGYRIAVENQAGSMRTFKSDDGSGKEGHVVMIHDYGFFQDFIGNDQEELDVYLGPNEDAKNVYVVHQMRKPDYRSFDEDKVFLGFNGPDAALGAYAAHRDDGYDAVGSMATIPVERFRAQLQRRGGIGKIRS